MLMDELKVGDHVFICGLGPAGEGRIVAVCADGWYKVHRPWHLGGVWVYGLRLSRITEE